MQNKIQDYLENRSKKMVSTKHMNKPWITPAIKRSIETKSNYFKLYKRAIISREVNDNYKKLLYRIIRRSKNKYFFRLLQQLHK